MLTPRRVGTLTKLTRVWRSLFPSKRVVRLTRKQYSAKRDGLVPDRRIALPVHNRPLLAEPRIASLRLAKSDISVRQSWFVARARGWLPELHRKKAALSFRA